MPGDQRLGEPTPKASPAPSERLDLHLAEARAARRCSRAQPVGRGKCEIGPHARPRRRPYPSMMKTASSCTRSAIAPGKRWMAGAWRNGGSRSATATGRQASVPSRSLSTSRAGERLHHGHLLVERETDQQRERVARDQRVGLVGVGEVQAIGHHSGDRPGRIAGRVAVTLRLALDHERARPGVGRVAFPPPDLRALHGRAGVGDRERSRTRPSALSVRPGRCGVVGRRRRVAPSA